MSSPSATARLAPIALQPTPRPFRRGLAERRTGAMTSSLPTRFRLV